MKTKTMAVMAAMVAVIGMAGAARPAFADDADDAAKDLMDTLQHTTTPGDVLIPEVVQPVRDEAQRDFDDAGKNDSNDSDSN